MYHLKTVGVVLITCALFTYTRSEIFDYGTIKSYVKSFNLTKFSHLLNDTSNGLWHGILRDCKKRVTFSCIQKNAYAYLDDTLIDRDNITVFDGLWLTKNNLNYGSCPRDDVKRNEVIDDAMDDDSKQGEDCEAEEKISKDDDENFIEPLSPLEEITHALRRKTVKFLATRNYEFQLPEFYFEGATIKISPREVDADGALLRVDFGQRALMNEGRIFIFKKIKKFIQTKLLTSLLALVLIIKLIKLKFMFVIPFLFGVGAAKKLFLKLLLFFIPAFAHIFKLCSSYYSAHSTKFHHHHHQIAHHHHHVPVPVPVPAYHDHHPHHHHEEDFDGYDYAHPHIQYRKDMEELKEWGIEPYEDSYPEVNQHLSSNNPAPGTLPAPMYSGSYGLPQYAPNARPVAAPLYQDKLHPAHAHNLAYSAYVDDVKLNRRPAPAVGSVTVATKNHGINVKNPYAGNKFQPQNSRINNGYPQVQRVVPQPGISAKTSGPVGTVIVQRSSLDDEFYGPIMNRLDEIFVQLKFFDEACRERLICSMYKNPTIYSPHSNLVSNELSRDPQEIQNGSSQSESSRRFYKYLQAARLGQDGGDCLRTYPCHVNTE